MKREIEYYIKFWKPELKSFFKRFKNRIKRIPYRIKKILKYLKLAYNDWDWDYSYMLSLEKAKLEDIVYYFSRSNIAKEDWAVARDAKICIKLIDIINEKDSSYDIKYKEKYNWEDYDVVPTKRVNVKNIKRFDGLDCYLSNSYKANVDLRYLVKDDLRIKKAWNLYCKIREYNMRNWWN